MPTLPSDTSDPIQDASSSPARHHSSHSNLNGFAHLSPSRSRSPATGSRDSQRRAEPRVFAFDSSPSAPVSPPRQGSLPPSPLGKPQRESSAAANGRAMASLTGSNADSGKASTGLADKFDRSMKDDVLMGSKSASSRMEHRHTSLLSRYSSESSHPPSRRSSPASGDDSVQPSGLPARKKFKVSDQSSAGASASQNHLDLERFRFKGTDKSASSRASTSQDSLPAFGEAIATVHVVSDGDDDDDAEGESDVELSHRPPNAGKTRRLVRGRRAPLSPETPPKQAKTPVTSPHSKKVFDLITSPQSPAAPKFSNDDLERLCKCFPDRGPDQVRHALEACAGDVHKASQILLEDAELAVAKSAARPPVAPPRKRGVLSRGPKAETSKRPAKYASESEEGVSSDGESYASEDGRTERDEAAALKWFQSNDEQALIDVSGCKPEQAKLIVSLRPFTSVEDLRSKLSDKKNRGISDRIFDNSVDLAAGYYTVDGVLRKCEEVGRELTAIFRSWVDEGDSNVAAKSKSRGAVNVDDDSDAGMHLASVSPQKQNKITTDNYLESQPAGLSPDITLKEYQLIGVNWLNVMFSKGLSCILADEMGLGKTAQVISFLTHLKAIGVKGPHLVIVPSSTLENWLREFRRFSPDLAVESYYGAQKQRTDLRYYLMDNLADVDVIVTTYNLASGSKEDRMFLRKARFNVAVYDEGHKLKNSQSKAYEHLVGIRPKWRLLLTGTPLQNNLQELISLLKFILPNYFESADEALRTIFKAKPDAHNNALGRRRIDRAKKMMEPFVLRRRKDQVLKDLPAKTERVEYCEMTAEQKEIYAETVARSKKVIVDGGSSRESTPIGEKAGKGQGRPSKESKDVSGSSANIVMDLRKAAAHPMLFRRHFNDEKVAALARDCLREPEFADRNLDLVMEDMSVMTDAELNAFAARYPSTRRHALSDEVYLQSAKVQALQRLIPEMRQRGDRILIFSQFVQLLHILQEALRHMGVQYRLLTGQTPVEERQAMIDEFTEDESIDVMLLSTKAGGLGINLITANVVIFYDLDFNPHNDKQAADRSYRIGQTKNVEVIKLICRDSIDEDVLSLGDRKLELAEQVAGEEDLQDEKETKIEAMARETLTRKLRERWAKDMADKAANAADAAAARG